MNKNIIIAGICGFGLGALAGKIYYGNLAKKEIASVMEAFSEKEEKQETKEDIPTYNTVSDEIPEDAVVIGINEPIKSPQAYIHESVRPDIEIIDIDSYSDYMTEDGQAYDSTTVWLYSDGALVEKRGTANCIIQDVDDYVGLDNLARIGNADCMYVRNHILKLDVEILKKEEKFSDVRDKENCYED